MKKSMAMMALLCGALATPALAQDEQRPRQRQQQQRDARQTQRGTGRQPRDQQPTSARAQRGQETCLSCDGETASFAVSGTLKGLRVMNRGGEQHLIARLQGRDGGSFLLDLGSVQGLRACGIGLRSDESMQVRGRSTSVGGRTPVIVVERFRVARGPTVVVTIPRSARERGMAQDVGQRQGSMAAATGVLIQGTITQTRDFEVDGLPDRHRLLKVRTTDGRTVVVDTGAAGTLDEDITLNRGEFVSVIGRLGRLNGRPVIFASHVADLATIDWRGQRRTREDMDRKQRRDGRRDPQIRRSRADEATDR